MTVLGTRIPRKRMLMLLMGLFIAGNVLSALAPAFGFMLAGRIVASLAHGAFFGIGAVVAAELVAPEKKAGAIAMMFTGLTVANVVGVPLGTFVGQTIGWRVTFLIVAALGVAGLLGIARLVPDLPSPEGGVRIRRELAAFRNVQVLLAMAMTVLGFGGVFAAITYITPMMTNVAGFADSSVTWLLVLFGLGMVAGNLIGGRYADRALMPMLYVALGALAVTLAVFTLTAHTSALRRRHRRPHRRPRLRHRAAAPEARPRPGRRGTHPGLGRQHRRLQPRQRPRRLARRTRDHHAASAGPPPTGSARPWPPPPWCSPSSPAHWNAVRRDARPGASAATGPSAAPSWRPERPSRPRPSPPATDPSTGPSRSRVGTPPARRNTPCPPPPPHAPPSPP